MDENYLDNLLNDVSSEDKLNNSFDRNVAEDAEIDLDFSDLDDLSLEELDDLDDLDLGDLDVDDIDFNDVDVTKINSEPSKVSSNVPGNSEGELNLDALIDEANMESATKEYVDENVDELNENAVSNESAGDVFSDALDKMDEDQQIQSFDEMENITETVENQSDSLDDDLDSSEMDAIIDAEINNQEDSDNMDLDDLFSALGIEEEGSDSEQSQTEIDEIDELLNSSMAMAAESEGLSDLSQLEDLDIPKIPEDDKKGKKKKDKTAKKSISEVLFGEPDEDDIQEAKEFEEKKAKKALEKEEKKAQNEVKKAEKQEKKALKEQQNQAKKEQALEKKKIKQAALQEEYEAEKNEKKVSTVTVIIVFVLFIALAAGVLFGTKQFSYTQVIKKAKDYFNRQRYRLAYDEVAGVDVKPKDEELKDRIYTVMYVERLYESYNNYMKLGKYDKAMDALLRGLEKYDEHHAEAVELGIEADLDYCRKEILDALNEKYKVDEARAYEMMKLSGQDYMNALKECSAGIIKE